jgi:hypothetical protein
MSIPFSIDLISDLNLTITDQFDWTGKPTSLFCVVSGNISDDLTVVERVLGHLDEMYRGIFYIDGSLEHHDLSEYSRTVEKIKQICSKMENVIYLHNHAIIINEIAVVGCNGWFGNRKHLSAEEDLDYIQQYKTDDVSYLSNTIKKFQNQKEIEKIVVISNSMPSEYLAFNNSTSSFEDEMNLALCLMFDVNEKVKTWVFGTDDLVVDVRVDRLHFTNNPRSTNKTYWPKRIEI